MSQTYAPSETTWDELPDWFSRLSVRRVRSAKVAHLCAATGHAIMPGQSYTRVAVLTHPGRVSTICNCDSACWQGIEE